MHFSAEIHDSNQLEFQSVIESRVDQPLELELFMLGPSRYLNDYSRTEFYQDYRSVMRFTDIRRRSYLRNLRDLTEQIKELATNHVAQRELSSPLCHALLLFASRLTTQIKKLRHLQGPNDREAFAQLLMDITAEIQWYRENYVIVLGNTNLNVPPTVSECVGNIDEFISTKLFWEVGIMIKSWQDSSDIAPLRESIQGILKSEAIYREKFRGRRAESSFSKQRFLTRYSNLKKKIDSPLFVDEVRIAQDKYYRNIFAAFGASLAAIWSLIADANTHRLIRNEDFGMRASLIALLVILAYVFKDRIKENSRDFLNARMNSKLPDYRSRFIYKAGSTLGMNLGQSAEWFSKIKLKNLPEELQKLHSLNILQDPATPYDIIAFHFRKRYDIGEMKTISGLPSSNLKEILRLNLSRISQRLDDSAKSVIVPDEAETLKLVETRRRYDIDLLIRITSQEEVGIAHYRAVLQKGVITKLIERTRFRRIPRIGAIKKTEVSEE
jgi:hypothetical protein